MKSPTYYYFILHSNSLLFGLIGSVNDLDTITCPRVSSLGAIAMEFSMDIIVTYGTFSIIYILVTTDVVVTTDVAVSVCGRSGLWPFRFVAVPVCGRFGLWPFRRVSSGQGKVREIPDLAKVREKSGNFVEGQGKNEYWEKSGKSQGICI